MTTTAKLTGANYNAPVSRDDLVFEQTERQRDLLDRLKLVFGHPDYISASSWGIVADSNPASETTTSTAPVVVSKTSGALTLDVNAGLVVTKSGFLIELLTAQSGEALSSTEIGVQNVVTLKYSTANPDTKTTSDFNRPAYSRRVTPTDSNLVAVYTITEWNALTSDEQYDHVPIAIVTPQTGADGSKTLSVDLGQSTYSWNRPWFSPVDVEHRAKTGSGTSSSTNPHGLDFSDLNAGDFTLPQLLLRVGAVASQARETAHVPGKLCSTTIPNGSLKTDTLGLYGSGTSAKYFELPFYPKRLGRVCSSADTTKEFAFRIVGRTNIVVQANSSVVAPTTEDLSVRATQVETLEPKLIGGPFTQFEATAIKSRELVIAGGKAYTSTSSVTLTDTMGDAGSVPMEYDFYFVDGKVVKNPQPLFCRTLVSLIGSGLTPDATQLGQGRMLVALDKAAAGASLSVKVRVTGTDSTGATVSELFTFDSSWTQGSAVPSCLTPTGSMLRGSQLFSTVTSLTLEESLNAGDDAAIQVWNVMHPTKTQELSYAAPIAKTQWDGVKFCTAFDARTVVVDLQNLEVADATMGAALVGLNSEDKDPTGTNTRRVLLVENFQNPGFGNLVDPDWDDWWKSQGLTAIASSDGNQPGLWGFYQSRAIARLGSGAGLQIKLVPFSTQVLEGSLANYPNLPTVEVSEQQAGGSWTAFSATTASGTSLWFKEWTWSGSTAKAIRIRIKRGYGLWGMLVTEDTT